MWTVGALFLVLQVLCTVNADCPLYYEAKENGNCYLTTNPEAEQTIKDIITSCDADQAYLPVIRNAFDNAMVRGFTNIHTWPILLGYNKNSGAWKWDYPGEQSTYTNWAAGDVQDKSNNAYMNKDGTWTTVAPVAPAKLQSIVCQTVNSVSKCTPKNPANIVDAYYIYNEKDQRCYWFTRSAGKEEPVNRTTASKFCNSKGGNLPIITSLESNQFVDSLYPTSYTSKLTNGPIGWIGLKYVAKDVKFVWDDGTVLDPAKDYTNFDIIDHSVGACVSISYKTATLGKWQMTDCDEKMYLTCQTGSLETTTTPPKRLLN